MRHAARHLIFALGTWLALGVFPNRPALGDAGAVVSSPVQEMVWRFSSGKVGSQGKRVVTSQGTFIDGAEINGHVAGEGDVPFTEGVFSIRFNLYSPAASGGGQWAGHWYLTGEWTITRNIVDPAQVKARHNPYVVRGSFQSALVFNPLENTGQVSIPFNARSVAGKALAVKGTFTGNSSFEGDLVFRTARRAVGSSTRR